MERVIRTDERIKRAEEIYQRRRMNNYGTNQARVNVGSNRKNYKLFKKMLIQIAACLIIYLVFYIVKNSNYIFSEEFLKQAKEVLSYDINIAETYDGVTNWFASLENQVEQEKNILPVEEQEEIQGENQVIPAEKQIADQEEVVNQEENNEEQSHLEMDLNQEADVNTLSVAEDSSSVSQTATDADIIKANYSIIKPLTRNNNFTFWSA